MEYWHIIGSIFGIFLAIALATKWRYSYWKRKGVYQLPTEFPFGSIREQVLAKLQPGDQLQKFYNHINGKGLKYGGGYLFFKPFFMPVCPTLIKNILLKDFSYFTDHGVHVNEELDPLSGHLFALGGEKWRKLRIKLTPTFTSSKMKMMFQTLVDCTEGLVDLVDSYGTKNEPVDTKEVLGRFTTDIIGSCAFGLECNSLKNPDSTFRIYGKKIVDNARFRIVVGLSFPGKLLDLIGFKSVAQDVEDFLLKVVKDTVSYREKNNIFRKDFLQLLIQLKNGQALSEENNVPNMSKSVQSTMTDNELAAQCFVFFAAGFETSSTLMLFTLYELTQNPEIQEKTRQEINEVLARHKGQLTYQAAMEMSYLEKVLYETLRLYPPLPLLFRVCNKRYKVPDTDVVINPGDSVQIAIKGLHMDPKYYPKPEIFDPERFNEENKRKRPDFTYLPFGDGPRICIGMRFGMMQSKIGIITLLRNYRITLNSKTKTPIKLDTLALTSAVDGGIWLNCEKIQ